VNARGQVSPQRPMHGAVALDPAEGAKFRCAQTHVKMAFSRPVVTRVTVMFVAFIRHHQIACGEGRAKTILNYSLDLHFLFSTPSSGVEIIYPCRPESESPEGEEQMTERQPFNFDIRVSSDKKRKTKGKRGMSGAFEGSGRPCSYPGCSEAGDYRAPKSPDHLDEYVWFCKDHVREYNLRWNFFQGQTDEEFQRFVDKDRVWGRETKPFAKRAEETQVWDRIDDAMGLLGARTARPATGSSTRKLPPTERRALEILDARDTWSKADIRKQYKSLVKDLHPDLNGGNRADEDRLQEVVWAWDQIKDSRNFTG
jgi:hypothetical protein